MRLLIIFIIFLAISCKSTNDMESKKLSSNDNKYLLSLSNKKVDNSEKKITTTYKNVPLQKEFNIESGDFILSFKNKVIFEGNQKCIFLLEVFNNEVLLISISNSSNNKYVAGPENFERNKILLIDINTGKRKLANFQKNIFLKSYKGSLNQLSSIKNVFAISDINYESSIMKLEDAQGKYSDVKLIELNAIPLKCNN